MELLRWSDHHEKLLVHLAIIFSTTLVVDVIGTVLVHAFEAGKGDIHTWGDAFFFTTVQLLTVSSQIKNPLTTTGRVIDVLLELWAVIVVAGTAGAMANFVSKASA